MERGRKTNRPLINTILNNKIENYYRLNLNLKFKNVFTNFL